MTINEQNEGMYILWSSIYFLITKNLIYGQMGPTVTTLLTTPEFVWTVNRDSIYISKGLTAVNGLKCFPISMISKQARNLEI